MGKPPTFLLGRANSARLLIGWTKLQHCGFCRANSARLPYRARHQYVNWAERNQLGPYTWQNTNVSVMLVMTPIFQLCEQNHLGPNVNGAIRQLHRRTMHQLFVRAAFIPARGNQSGPIQVGLLPLVFIIALRPCESIVQRCNSKQQEAYISL